MIITLLVCRYPSGVVEDATTSLVELSSTNLDSPLSRVPGIGFLANSTRLYVLVYYTIVCVSMCLCVYVYMCLCVYGMVCTYITIVLYHGIIHGMRRCVL